MDPRSWIVAGLAGLALGLSVGRYRQDRRAALTAQVLAALVGVAAWLGSPDHAAGPSLVVGGTASVLGHWWAGRRAVRRERQAQRPSL